MSNTKTSMPAVRPEEKATVEMDAAPKWAIALTEKVNGGFSEMRGMRHDIDLLVGGMSSLKVDVREIQRWKMASEERQEAASMRSREPSQHDIELKTELKTELNAEKQAREALAVEVAETKALIVENTEVTLATKKAVVGVINNPKVRAVAKVLFASAMAYSAARGWLVK